MQEGCPKTATKMSQSVGLGLGEVKYSIGGEGGCKSGPGKPCEGPKRTEEAKGDMRGSSWDPREGEEKEE